MTYNPYTQSGGPPKMLPSFVCYADILGYAQLSKEALDAGKGSQFLIRLREALSSAYKRVRKHSEGMGDRTFFAVKVFTDNIVVGYPVTDHEYNLGEPELGNILLTFAEFQAGLAMEGFFLRGGIAFGEHFMDDDIVFGDALLQAYGLDKAGGPPRLAFTSSAVKLIRGQLGFYGEVKWSPQYEELLEDADGTIFLNYLGEAFFAFPEGGIFFELIEKHQRFVEEGLQAYRGLPGVRAKFEWAARYHNFICREFAERNPISYDPNADPEDAFAVEEAQILLDYIIDVESLAAEPCRINLEPIRLKRK